MATMKVVCAPNAFKESLTSPEICSLCVGAIGTRAKVVSAPLADGGDGTLEVFRSLLVSSKLSTCLVTSALSQQKIAAPLLWDEQHKTAVIELARICGLAQVPPEFRNPLIATTRGVGQLCVEAVRRGAQQIYIGVGGSATNDGGTGALQALGWKFLDSSSNPCGEGGLGLIDLDRIVPSAPFPSSVTVLCDVRNPLCGPGGASHIYGPQKGASEDDVIILDRAMLRFAEVARASLGIEIDVPGAGAAGGFAAGALLGLNARLVSGFETISELVDLERHIAESDLVITGEGRLDDQTMQGKAVAGVLNLASKYHKPVVLVVGSSALHQPPDGTLVIPLVNERITLQHALAEPHRTFFEAVEKSWDTIVRFAQGGTSDES